MGIARGLAVVALVACRSSEPAPPPPPPTGQVIKVAVIGGMVETGLWQAVAERYTEARGNRIELVASGPKREVVEAFRQGGIDLITVHACDAMINLVADGLARDPEPWARNDLVIVGPAADPAQIRGSSDAVAAIGKIIAARAPLLVHASMGADGVLHDLEEAGHFALDRRLDRDVRRRRSPRGARPRRRARGLHASSAGSRGRAASSRPSASS